MESDFRCSRIIGRNFNLSWRFRETFAASAAFYEARQEDLGMLFFHRRRLVRLFKDEREREVFTRKRDEGRYEDLLSDPQPDPLLLPPFEMVGSDVVVMCEE